MEGRRGTGGPRREGPWWIEILFRWVDAVACLVPAHRRTDWKGEWKAEITHAVRHGRGGGRVRRASRWSGSVLVDAFWLRVDETRVEDGLESLRLSSRALARSPLFTALAVLVLGLGVGATTAIFSLADWALFRPVPGVEAPEELLGVIPRPEPEEAGFAPLSHPTVVRLTAGGSATEAVAAYSSVSVDVAFTADGPPRRFQGQFVTPGFFRTLGVGPLTGRAFREEEGEPGSVHAVAVVSDALWREHLGGQRDALGRVIELNATRFEVVGVAPSDFRGPSRTDAADLWIPSSAIPVVMSRAPANLLAMETAPLWASLVVRKPSGTTTDAVRAQLRRAAPELASRNVRLQVSEHFGVPEGLRTRMGGTLAVLGGLVVLLLALTVANLVNLLLSRLARRQHEVAVRRALGASTGRLTFGVATEGLVIALGGAGAAILTGFALLALLDGFAVLPGVPETGGVPLDHRVLGFALAGTVAVSGAASLVAARGIQHLAPTAVLRAGRGVTDLSGRFRRALVVLQVALSLALMVGSGLLIRSLWRLQSTELGYRPGGVVVFSLSPGAQSYSVEEADRLFRELVPELQRAPEIESASFAWMDPFRRGRYMDRVAVPGRASEDEVESVVSNMVTPGFFQDLGIEIVEGRAFDGREYGQAERPRRGAVVLNQSLARRLFPEGSPVGRDVVMPGRREEAFEVIGVVADARLGDPTEEPVPTLFDPFGNGYRTDRASFVVRGSADPAEVASRIRETVRRLDPRLPVLDAEALPTVVASYLSEERGLARIASAFAVLALVLSAGGLFGLMSELVERRIREFGVRTTLGATSARVVGLVLKESLATAAVGMVAGLALAWGVGRLLATRLAPGTGSADPIAFLAASLLLCLVVLVASIPPALRSTRIDPVRALRIE